MAVKNYSVDKTANLAININVSNNSTEAAIDLTGYTTNAYYRTHPDASNTVTMTTTGYANGLLVVSLTGTQTANADIGRYVYEVYMTQTSSNTITRVQEGILTFTGGLA